MPLNTQQLATVSLVRNEADIIEAFVRHHLGLVGRMLVILHRPNVPNLIADNTEQILNELVAEGLPLEVRIFEENNYAQRKVITNAVQDIAKRPDIKWVFPLDADEFLMPLGGRTLLEALAEFDDSMAQQMAWQTYVPTALDDQGVVNPACRIQRRRVREPERTNKVIVPANLAANPKSRISQGSHRFKMGKISLNVECDSIALAHIPIRSIRQIRTKVFNGWLQDLSTPNKTDGPNLHWGKLYERLSCGEEITGSILEDLALDYRSSPLPDPDRSLILDPIPATESELRYEIKPINPWAVLAANAEAMAKSVGERNRSGIFSWRAQ
ncbi:MAG: hypothetical protein ACI97A_003442 [Planctomycetota bacterium]